MVPPFDLQGGVWLAAARDASLSAQLSALGTVAFRNFVAPRAFGRMPPEMVAAVKRRLLWLAQGSVVAAMLGMCLWLVMQASYMADAESLSEAFKAARGVLVKTTFGFVVELQVAALVVLAAVLGWRDSVGRQRMALGIAAIAVALQAGHSHAFSMVEGPSLLLACDIVHLLGAGAWLGALVPLVLVVRMAPPRAAASAARWFSPMGQCCLWALLVSACVQGWVLVASIPGLIGTTYGWMVLIKIALFGILFAFAWLNRYRFGPALWRDHPEAAKRVLLRSLMAQTGFGVAILFAAVVLSGLPPAMHSQALWPFAERFSLAAVREDPDFRREVMQAGLALAGATALVIVALVMRRWRLAAVVAAAPIAWFAVPHLDLLMATAYPTSYYHSPSGFTSASVAQGRALFAQNCVACHGAEGMGNGPVAKTLAVPPADLTAAHLWAHSDGELFWWLTDGMDTPEGQKVMPGFGGLLDEDSRWALIDYIRAHNAGVARRVMGDWTQAIAAPGFGARCGGDAVPLADLRGRFVRLVIGAGPRVWADGNVVTVVAGAPEMTVSVGMCVTDDETVPTAYAVVSGVAPEAVVGAQFLIDGDGWLRAMRLAGDTAAWDDPAELRAEIGKLRERKVAAPERTGMHMNMKMPM